MLVTGKNTILLVKLLQSWRRNYDEVFLMVLKVDGAEMTCKGCGTELICHMSNYKGDFKNKLQWQNEDGTAHYATNNGKDFTCNIPEQEEETTPNEIELKPNEKSTLESEQKLSKGESVPDIISLATLHEKIKTVHGMCEAILHIVTDLKTKGVKIQQ